MSEPLYLAKSEDGYPALLPQMANRHGLITGATGTGKTVTLQSIAERLSYAGVPVFMADVKGDLSGMGAAGNPSRKAARSASPTSASKASSPTPTPVAFWDVFGESGHPVRATISDMGPLLLARLLNLNDTQAGVLQLVFKIADDQGLLLLDLKDLRAMVQYVGDNAKDFTTEYGNISAASIGAIQRGLLTLEEQGGDLFFGEPMLNIDDLMQTDAQGRGVINILAADKLIQRPSLYSTFLLWLLSELFEHLPEVGDLDKPKLVFFFDEAHLLFNDAPKALVDKIEQVVRLIRSKGVGVYFVTQNPLDVPDKILGQLGNRGPARPARLHPARPEGRPDRRRNHARQPRVRRRHGHHRTRRRRSAGFLPRRERAAEHRRTRLHPAARLAPRPARRRTSARPSSSRRWSSASTRRRLIGESAYEKLRGGAGCSSRVKRSRLRRARASRSGTNATTGAREPLQRPAAAGSVVWGTARRHDRAAWRPARRFGRGAGQVCSARHRLAGRARDHPRRARLRLGGTRRR